MEFLQHSLSPADRHYQAVWQAFICPAVKQTIPEQKSATASSCSYFPVRDECLIIFLSLLQFLTAC